MGPGSTEAPPRHPRFARVFAAAVDRMDGRGGADHRRKLLRDARGTVAELGSGTGANFAWYPPTVEQVIALEPEPSLRARSAAAARQAPVPISVVDGTAEALPLDDGSADTVVASLVLCSVTDPRRAIDECRRVLRADGLLLFYEHVRSFHPVVAAAEDLVTPVWSRLAGGCHPNRDTIALLEVGRFRTIELDRFGFSPLPLTPRVAHVLGSARPEVSAPGGRCR